MFQMVIVLCRQGCQMGKMLEKFTDWYFQGIIVVFRKQKKRKLNQNRFYPDICISLTMQIRWYLWMASKWIKCSLRENAIRDRHIKIQIQIIANKMMFCLGFLNVLLVTRKCVSRKKIQNSSKITIKYWILIYSGVVHTFHSVIRTNISCSIWISTVVHKWRHATLDNYWTLHPIVKLCNIMANFLSR